MNPEKEILLMKTTSNRKSALYRFIVLMLVFAMAFTLYACGDNKNGGSNDEASMDLDSYSPIPKEPEPEPEPDPVINLLTGEIGTKDKVIKTRVVGVVVENHPAARPQWGMDDPKYAPDIILQGEVEGGITRMFWMWGDYKKMPEYVGPVRSARPPFIKFSELFDAIFVHWGMSHTLGPYTGANDVFKADKVSHLNGMNYERSAPFDRMQGTGRAIEHTAIVYGGQLPETLDAKFRTELKANRTTQLNFYESKKIRGNRDTCYSLSFRYSRVSDTTDWTYNPEDKMFHTSSFNNDVARDNLLVLFDKTEYITNAKTTYCNYLFKGGNAYYASCGSIQKVRWRVEDGKLYLYKKTKVTAEDGTETTEEKPFKINPGKTWIGWGSYNNGGSIDFAPKAE